MVRRIALDLADLANNIGFTSALLTLGGLGVGTFLYGATLPVWTYIWENYVQILTANLLISFSLATFVYARSFSVKSGNSEYRELAAGGHSGNLLYDWFIGRELNPRIELPIFGVVDIKVWCEMRPGLLGWLIFDLAFMARQYATHGYVTDSMLLTVGFQGLYVLDAIYMEPAILTTMDITTDGFGFMLSFGDLVWVPFIYSIQAHYLAIHPVHLGWTGVVGVLSVQALGYYLFRASNNEKNRFRSNPNDPKIKHLQYMTTASGSKLLVSGWWGTARHINYLGDWIMAWSYCLPTGLAGYTLQRDAFTGTTAVVRNEAVGWGMIFTYFYVVYFGVLLVHRESRDEEKCARKYGADWEEYKRRVRWRIIPYIY
jgi:Delta14-sterol reductase